MTAYFGYLLLIGIQKPLFIKRDRLKRQYFDRKRYLILCCLELVLLAGIRGHTIGADTVSYLSAVSYYGKLPVLQRLTAELVYPYHYEIGYFTLTKLAALFGIGKTGFLFVVALLTYFPVFSTIKEYSPMPYISILCYFAFGFFSYSLGIFRQMIASSILLCGWKYIERRNLIKYILVVSLAMTFHTSAGIGILLYFLYGMNWKHVIGWIVPAQIVLLLFGRVLAMMLIHVFPKYSGYVGGRYDTQGGTYLMLLLLDVVLLVSVLLHNEQRKEIENMSICALMLAICVQCIGYSMGVLGRATRHFSVYLILAIPNVIYNLKRKIGYRWALVVTIVAVVCLFGLTYMELDGDKYIVPYYTIFR